MVELPFKESFFNDVGHRIAIGVDVPAAIDKTLQIYLPTDESLGIRIAEITTRIVQAVLVPRSELALGKLRPEIA